MGSLTDIYLAHPAWSWIGLAAALLAAEAATGSGWLLWPAASAGLVAVVQLFVGLSPAAALTLFAMLTLVSTVLARRYFPRRLRAQGEDINDAIGRLVGREGRAVSSFQSGAGRVFVDGKEWAAELEAPEPVEAGARVAVVGVDGARLKVRGTS